MFTISSGLGEPLPRQVRRGLRRLLDSVDALRHVGETHQLARPAGSSFGQASLTTSQDTSRYHGCRAPMSHLLIRRAGLGLLILLFAVGESGCAAARPLPLVRPVNSAAVTNLTDLQLPPGIQCLVGLIRGESLCGTCESNSGDQLELRWGMSARRRTAARYSLRGHHPRGASRENVEGDPRAARRRDWRARQPAIWHQHGWATLWFPPQSSANGPAAPGAIHAPRSSSNARKHRRSLSHVSAPLLSSCRVAQPRLAERTSIARRCWWSWRQTASQRSLCRAGLSTIEHGGNGPLTWYCFTGTGPRRNSGRPSRRPSAGRRAGRFVFPQAPDFTRPTPWTARRPGMVAAGPGLTHPCRTVDARPVGLRSLQGSRPLPRSSRSCSSGIDDLAAAPIVDGYSQGAMVASEVAFRSDTPLRALVLLSGTMVDEASWERNFSRRRGLASVHRPRTGRYHPAVRRRRLTPSEARSCGGQGHVAPLRGWARNSWGSDSGTERVPRLAGGQMTTRCA